MPRPLVYTLLVLGSLLGAAALPWLVSRSWVRTAEQSVPLADGAYTDLEHTAFGARAAEVVARLSALESRLPGTPGHAEAAAYVQAQLAAIGPARVWSETFSVSVPLTGRCALRLEHGTDAVPPEVPVFPLWPNLVRTNQTPPEGLAGPLVDGGALTAEALQGKSLQGALVLADFSSGDRFLHAIDVGAAAVLFVEPDATVRGEAEDKLLSVPVRAPRYYLSREAGTSLRQRLASGEPPLARLVCDQRWAAVEAHNIIAEIPGTDPRLANEVIALAAYYDAMSVVPDRAPGASQACGVGGLLALAGELAARSLERPVWLVALSGHGSGLAGARDFAARHMRGHPLGLTGAALHDAATAASPEVVLFVGLDLSAGSDTVMALRQGFWYHYDEDETHYPYRRMGLRLAKTVEDMAAAAGVEARDLPFINALRPLPGVDWRAELACAPGFDAEAAIGRGTFGLTLATARDLRQWVDTPLDMLDRLDLSLLARQLPVVWAVLRDLLADPASWHDPAAPQRMWKWKDWTCNVQLRLVESELEAGFLPSQPVAGGLGVVRHDAKSAVGVRGDLVVCTDDRGRATVTGVGWPAMRDDTPVRDFLGFRLDADSGELVMAPDLGVGSQDFPLSLDLNAPEEEVTLLLFPCRATDLYNLVDPRLFVPLLAGRLIDARTDSQPLSYGLVTSKVSQHDWNPWAADYLARSQPVAVLLNPPGSRFKATFGHGAGSPRMVLINATAANPRGVGYPADETGAIPHAALAAASDLVTLNDSRLAVFQRHGIDDRRTVEFHAGAQRALRQALAARERGDYRGAVQQAEAAWALAIRAYRETLAVAGDVLRGVLFYLVLLIPFSIFVERVFFGCTGVYGRIAACGLVFLAVFYGLAAVHPAFRLTSMPFVVLLAFITFVLTVFVSAIIFTRFGDYLRVLSERTAGSVADTGRVDLLGTAFMVGVSNMNRRSGRTLLTLVSITVLAFAATSFTSVTSQVGASGQRLGDGAPYNGLLLRDPQWRPLNASAAAAFQTEFGDDAAVAPRYWLLPGQDSRATILATAADGRRRFRFDGILGVAPAEARIGSLDPRRLRGRVFESDSERGAILSARAAEALGIGGPGAHIHLLGLDLEVVGILADDDPHGFAAWRDLDDAPLAPIRFDEIAAKYQAGAGGDRLIAQYRHLDPATTLILPAQLVQGLGGRLQSVAAVFPETYDLTGLLDDLFQRKELLLYVGQGGERFLYSSVGSKSLRGPAGLAVPMLIMFFIVLNTMLGSVYERRGEIAIHSAVGLSPLHIAGLFIAEACVYGVIGCLTGYFIGQGVAWIVRLTGALPGVVTNYSSLSAVATAAMVMGTVLASTLYPAWQAARIATPGERALWHFPKPEGDRILLELPFTASAQGLGLMRFLEAFLLEHKEGHGGSFISESAVLNSSEDRIRLSATIWLAPFDLGVSQHFALELVPFEGTAVRIAQLRLERRSGDHESWCRANRAFLNALRKQFLVWRSFADSLRERYETRSAE